MNKNNKILVLVLIVIIMLLIVLGIIAWLFLSKPNFSAKSGGSSFGTFKSSTAKNTDAVPSELKWKDPFANDKKRDQGKSQGSYFQYISEKNKKN